MTYRLTLMDDKLLLASLLALFLAGSSYVRVLLRSVVEGPVFQWSYFGGVGAAAPATVQGQGLIGHTDTILVGAFAVIWLLWAVSHRPDRFMVAALIGWNSLQLGSALWLAARFGDELRVSKETIGLIDVSFAWFTLPPLVLAWVLSVVLGLRTWRRADPASTPSWTRRNTALALVAAAALAGSAVALNLGAQHGPGDFAGVGLMYVGLLAMLLALAPWRAVRP